jgi:uncharacterized peroxidase-related enzyme
MKLAKVESGDSLVSKLKLGAMRLQLGERAPDIARVLLYRPELFGAPISKYAQRLLRDASEWTVGERELIAAYVSHCNECRYCYGAHRAVAERALGSVVVDAVFKEISTAPISPQLRETLAFVRKLVIEPTAVTRDDADAARASGVSQTALEDAVHVCAAFCIINRLANSLGFEILSFTGFDRAAKFLLKYGYDH